MKGTLYVALSYGKAFFIRQLLLKGTLLKVAGSELNMLAKEMWLTSYRKNEPTKLEFLLYYNPAIFFLLSKNTKNYNLWLD